MKSVLMALVLIAVPTLAQASFFQGYCSQAEGQIQTAYGHHDNYIQLTRYDYKTGKKTRLRDENGAFKMETLKTTEIGTDNRESCENGYGGYSTTDWTAQKVRITKKNGGLFSKDIQGVTSDLKAVEGVIICEQHISGMLPCGK